MNENIIKKYTMKFRDIVGIAMIIIGLFFMIEQFTEMSFISYLWPLIIILVGLAFFLMWFKEKKNWGLLIPATIVSVYGIYFCIMVLVSWRYVGETSFIYPFAVALAFFVAHYIGKANRGMLVPAWILLGVGFIVLISTTGGGIWWPLIIIGVGFWMIYQNKLPIKKDSDFKASFKDTEESKDK